MEENEKGFGVWRMEVQKRGERSGSITKARSASCDYTRSNDSHTHTTLDHLLIPSSHVCERGGKREPHASPAGNMVAVCISLCQVDKREEHLQVIFLPVTHSLLSSHP